MSPCLVDGCAEGVGVNWRPLIEFVVSIGYGVLSSVVPIFNSEIYIVASQVGGFTEEVTTAVGCAVGQTIGYVEGREAAQPFEQPPPIDAINAALVDEIFYHPETTPA